MKIEPGITRIMVREGWETAGRLGTAVGHPIHINQDWLPVVWDNEEDPTFFKMGGLEAAPEPHNHWWQVITPYLRGSEKVVATCRYPRCSQKLTVLEMETLLNALEGDEKNVSESDDSGTS
jgi:hypothetical protein